MMNFYTTTARKNVARYVAIPMADKEYTYIAAGV